LPEPADPSRRRRPPWVAPALAKKKEREMKVWTDDDDLSWLWSVGDCSIRVGVEKSTALVSPTIKDGRRMEPAVSETKLQPAG
jgi:hypothetical protein